ncbi:MAG: F0F1 ATP synthase subunit B [Armatimonadota bacterium]
MEILNIDPRVLAVQVGGFLLLLVVFRLFLFRPIMDILDARRQEVEENYRRAEEHQRVAEQLRSEYEAHLANIEEEMRAKIAQAIKEGQAMRDEIIASSRAKAENTLNRALEQIEREKEKSIEELKAAVADLAISATSKLLQEELDDARHRQLVSRFIEEISAEMIRTNENQRSGGDLT